MSVAPPASHDRVRSRDADVLRDAVADLAVGHDVIPRGHAPVEVGLLWREVVMPASMIDVMSRRVWEMLRPTSRFRRPP